jgi:hypothetical protein
MVTIAGYQRKSANSDGQLLFNNLQQPKSYSEQLKGSSYTVLLQAVACETDFLALRHQRGNHKR